MEKTEIPLLEGEDCAAVGNWKQHSGGIPPRGIAVEETEIPLLGRGGIARLCGTGNSTAAESPPEELLSERQKFLCWEGGDCAAVRNWNKRQWKMIRKGFKMKLNAGQEAEYEKRHNELWPEMRDMIHEHGGKNYSIYLDRETLTLFGYIEIEDEELWSKGADTEINRKWWDFMADIMETNPDNSPVSVDLEPVFHLD